VSPFNREEYTVSQQQTGAFGSSFSGRCVKYLSNGIAMHTTDGCAPTRYREVVLTVRHVDLLIRHALEIRDPYLAQLVRRVK
jgi:hypothetical protein